MREKESDNLKYTLINMTGNSQIEILFIEDNHHEAELTIRTLKKHHLSNTLKHIADGAEALDFILAKGVYSDRADSPNPKLILLDLKLPKVNGGDTPTIKK